MPDRQVGAENPSYRKIAGEKFSAFTNRLNVSHWSFLAVLYSMYIVELSIDETPTPVGIPEQDMMAVSAVVLVGCVFCAIREWRAER